MRTSETGLAPTGERNTRLRLQSVERKLVGDPPRDTGVVLHLKRSLGGTYHAFDFAKHAHRYLAEAQYRFNRRFNLRSILARLLRAACLTTPPPALAIRAAEVGRQSGAAMLDETTTIVNASG